MQGIEDHSIIGHISSLRRRAIFNRAMLDLLDGPDVPRSLKVNWNDQINRIAAGEG